MEPGAKVGAGRWPGALPYQPWCWGRPWSGTLLAIDDPRAWTGSIAFGTRVPTRKECAAHVAWCRAQGLLESDVPVLWHFGDREVVYWERADRVVAYEADLVSWRQALDEAIARAREDRKAA